MEHTGVEGVSDNNGVVVRRGMGDGIGGVGVRVTNTEDA